MLNQLHICPTPTKISKEVYKIDTNYQCYKLRGSIIHIPKLQGISGKYRTAETRTRKRPHCIQKKKRNPQLNPVNVPRKAEIGDKDGLSGSE